MIHNIVVTEFRPFSKNTLKGFVTVELPDAGLILKECPWHEKEGREWIGFPGRKYTGNDGVERWTNLIEFRNGFDRNAWQEAAIKAIYRHLGQGQSPDLTAAG